jgi:predicted nicotinamide N-methyase
VETVLENVVVGPFSLSIERPPDAYKLIDEAAFERDEFLPYWAELWPAGLELARLVANRDVRGLRVLELGCGLGVPSIVAALGGADVLATDWSPDALALLERNAARNGATLTTRNLDWRKDEVECGCDLVLAADVLYERTHPDLLLALLARLEAREVLLADPARSYARVFLERAGETCTWQIKTLVERDNPRVTITSLSL